MSTPEDFLDEDPALRGQNYVCLSFVSPEDVLQNKEVYFLSRYVQSLGVELKSLFATMKEKYPADAGLIDTAVENNKHFFNSESLQDAFQFFKGQNSAQLESEFHAQNNFRTTLRGIKVRGVFDTVEEAKNRARVLKAKGDRFNIYVAQVGCWCPWSPNPDDIANQEHSNTQLNELMKKYKENDLKRDIFYEERKSNKLGNAAHLAVQDAVIPADQSNTLSVSDISNQLQNTVV